MKPKNQQTEVLAYFPNNLRDNIIRFTDHIASIEADFIVFMARKSIRLYDLLCEAGFRRHEKIVLTDHIFDHDLECFKNKSVALIDDTLISGSTLSNTANALIAAGAKQVTTHVLFADEKYWCRHRITPEYVGSVISNEEMLSFCYTSVLALQSRAIPYLTEFPFFKRFKIPDSELDTLMSSGNWIWHPIENERLKNTGNSYYSLLPSPELLEQITQFITGQSAPDDVDSQGGYIDLIKVRLFTRAVRGNTWIRVVPIVALSPLNDEEIASLLEQLSKIIFIAKDDRDAFLLSQNSPTGRYRVAQYILSLIIGAIFAHQIKEETSNRAELTLDEIEALRYFGPWFSRFIPTLHHRIAEVTENFAKEDRSLDISVTSSPLPDHEFKVSKKEILKFAGISEASSQDIDEGKRSLLVELTQAFIQFYYKYEIPARLEALNISSTVDVTSKKDNPNRDRLNFGFSWPVLAKTLLRQGANLTTRRLNLLSIALDHLIDWGIAVPILAYRDNVVFRAYRHGEGVPFGDQEIALTYDAVEGYLEGTQKSSLAGLSLEKLITCLMRIGVQKNFLDVLYGQGGYDGVAKVGYHLHGAVPFFPDSDTYLADNKGTYITTYLKRRGVLKQKGDSFFLGQRPDAALRITDASEDANMLGELLGKLRALTHAEGKLSTNDFIILATCPGPKDTTAALLAEARIFCRWAREVLLPALDGTIAGKKYAEPTLLEIVTGGVGAQAINSARLKYNAFQTGRFDTTIKRCAQALGQLANGRVLEKTWRRYWSGLSKWENQEEVKTFTPWIKLIGLHIYIVGLQLLMLRAATIYENNKYLPQKLGKLRRQISDWDGVFLEKLKLSDGDEKFHSRLIRAISREEEISDSAKALAYTREHFAIQLSRLSSTAVQATEVLNNFARVESRIDFSTLLWYDIIDSRGKKGGYSKKDQIEYRERVKKFRREIATDLNTLRINAKRQNIFVHSTYGSIDGNDDEKHIFFARGNATAWAFEALDRLKRRAMVHRVKFRAILIPANFAGMPAHKYRNSQEIEGQVFWEHFRSLEGQLRHIEDNNLLAKNERVPKHSILWLCGWNAKTFSVPSGTSFTPISELAIETEIDFITVSTHSQCGWIS